MKCEACMLLGIEKEAKYYRKIDSNPRPLCQKHFDGVGGNNQFSKMMIQRHYFEIELNKKEVS